MAQNNVEAPRRHFSRSPITSVSWSDIRMPSLYGEEKKCCSSGSLNSHILDMMIFAKVLYYVQFETFLPTAMDAIGDTVRSALVAQRILLSGVSRLDES